MAAGLGYKEFATGDVLTAADANGYLASQVVMVFASAAARTSAIASPQEGMISYLKDTNSTEYYSGSAWVAIGGASGSMTSIGSGTLTSTTTTITPGSSYKNLIVVLRNARLTSNGYIQIQLNSITSYDYVFQRYSTGGYSGNGGLNNSAFNLIESAPSAASGNAFYVEVPDYNNSTAYKLIRAMGSYTTPGGAELYMVQGASKSTAAVTTISIVTTGTWSSGTYEVFGVN